MPVTTDKEREKEVRTNGKNAGHRFCEKHFLSDRTLQGMTDMASQFWDQLSNLGMLPNLRALRHDERDAARAKANRYADNTELLRSSLPCGPKMVTNGSSSPKMTN